MAEEEEEPQGRYLPEEIVFGKVLPCLPVPAIFQMRCVCHAWNSHLRCRTFLRQYLQSQYGEDGWLVMARKIPGPDIFARELIAYVPSLRRWLPLPLPFPHIASWLGHPSYHLALANCGSASSSFLMASGAGFICFPVWITIDPFMYNPIDPFTDIGHALLLHNPLTGSIKMLPPCPPSSNFRTISMLHDPARNTFKVVLSNEYHDYRRYLCIYDSHTGSWSSCANVSDFASGNWNRRTHSPNTDVLHADLFVYNCQDDSVGVFSLNSTAWRLHGFHAESCTWSRVYVQPPMPLLHGHTNHVVRKLNGRVLLILSFKPEDSVPSALQGFCVWELKYSSADHFTTSWVEVVRTPSELLAGAHDDDVQAGTDSTYIINGRFICMTHGGDYLPPLVYDLGLDSWYRLPASLYEGGTGFLGLFSFQPHVGLLNEDMLSLMMVRWLEITKLCKVDY